MTLQELFPVCCRQDFLFARLYAAHLAAREVAAVVDEPDVVGLQVLPRPVKRGELTVMRVFRTDIVAGVIALKADALLACASHMDWQIAVSSWHPVGLMRRDKDLDLHGIRSP